MIYQLPVPVACQMGGADHTSPHFATHTLRWDRSPMPEAATPICRCCADRIVPDGWIIVERMSGAHPGGC